MKDVIRTGKRGAMPRSGCAAAGTTGMQYVSFGSGPRVLAVLPGLSDGLATVKGKAWILSLPYRRYFRDFTVYLFSRKDDMPEEYTIRDMAEDQVLAMDALGIRKICLLGVSQGGMIAQSIAAEHPDRVEKLILAVTASYANSTVKEAVSGWIGMAVRGDHRALMTDPAERMYSKAYLRKYGRLFPLLAAFTKPAGYDRFLKNAYAILDFDARDVLSKVSCPTLIIAGVDDRTVGNDAPYELNAAISGSELFIYKGLGHGLFEEAKDFYDRVLAFCARGEPGPAD